MNNHILYLSAKNYKKKKTIPILTPVFTLRLWCRYRHCNSTPFPIPFYITQWIVHINTKLNIKVNHGSISLCSIHIQSPPVHWPRLGKQVQQRIPFYYITSILQHTGAKMFTHSLIILYAIIIQNKTTDSQGTPIIFLLVPNSTATLLGSNQQRSKL